MKENKHAFVADQGRWLSHWDRWAIDVNWFSWYTLYSYCPGWVKEDCEDRGIPWFGVRLGWLKKEFLFRLMVLTWPRERLHMDETGPHADKCRYRIMRGEARSLLGRPHVLLTDFMEPRITHLKSIDGFDKRKQWWQFRYILACFVFNVMRVIKRTNRAD